MILGNKQIRDRILVAAGAAQPDRVPDVGEFGRAFREQHRAHDRRAVGLQPRPAVGFDHRHMAAEPARMMAAAGKAPGRGDAIAAGYDARLARPRAPGEDAARVPKDLARDLGREIGRGHRAARILVDAPGGAGVDHRRALRRSARIAPAATRRRRAKRQQQAEEAALDQRIDDRLGQFAPAVDLVARGGEIGRDLADSRQIVASIIRRRVGPSPNPLTTARQSPVPSDAPSLCLAPRATPPGSARAVKASPVARVLFLNDTRNRSRPRLNRRQRSERGAVAVTEANAGGGKSARDRRRQRAALAQRRAHPRLFLDGRRDLRGSSTSSGSGCRCPVSSIRAASRSATISWRFGARRGWCSTAGRRRPLMGPRSRRSSMRRCRFCPTYGSRGNTRRPFCSSSCRSACLPYPAALAVFVLEHGGAVGGPRAPNPARPARLDRRRRDAGRADHPARRAERAL